MNRSYAFGTLIAAAGMVGTTLPAEAAVLTGEYTFLPAVNGTGSGNYSAFVNFADEGTVDWALWNPPSGSQTGAPTDRKADANMISNLYTVGGSTNMTRVGGSDLEISITPGATTGSATSGVVVNSSYATDGAGVGFTITVPTTDQYTARVYVGGFKTGENTLLATLPGVDPVEFNPVFGAGRNNFKDAGLLELTFQADSLTDGNNVLIVTIAVANDDNSSHVFIQGATLVPEPAALSLLGLGGLTLLRRRRAV